MLKGAGVCVKKASATCGDFLGSAAGALMCVCVRVRSCSATKGTFDE